MTNLYYCSLYLPQGLDYIPIACLGISAKNSTSCSALVMIVVAADKMVTAAKTRSNFDDDVPVVVVVVDDDAGCKLGAGNLLFYGDHQLKLQAQMKNP